jgi:Outer membrane receptor for ferrienterochelin and colicins
MTRHLQTLLLLSTSAFSLMSMPALAQQAAAEQESKDNGLAEIIVTAQKRAENLQDVPIAVSAFSADTLQERGLNGGADLQIAVPNVSFGTTGFGRYNFQIRGIGAQIQGLSADTGVGIHENNIPLTVNRLAGAEFYDIERVEVLRGPQGTLYGRNATGGVVNTITATPKQEFSGQVSAEYGRYDRKKLSGFINVPISETLAVRAAGTWIKRDGNIYNAGTGNFVNSADVWSTRLTVQWEPSDRIRIRGMWEHFEQDDTAGANAKIICAPNAGPTSIGGVATNPFTQSLLSNGCLNTVANDPRNNGVPSSSKTIPGLFGLLFGTTPLNAFAGKTLSNDLHTVEASFDPYQRAKNDLLSLQIELDLNDTLTLTSLSAYSKDRFSALTTPFGGIASVGFADTLLTPGGFFTDPQLGTNDRLESRTFVRQKAKQFSQEIRLQSDFDSKFNFNFGGIYLDYKANEDIIFLANTTTQAALALNVGGAGIYVDPLQIPDGTGHNYYNNSNPYRLKSGALFGEAYFQATDTLKATLGLRYTNDRKAQVTNPTLLLAPGRGFPAIAAQKVKFEEITGRFTVDWKPVVSFTDDTLVYGSYARGYKGGGFNPGATAISGVSPSYKPELVNAFEFGTKNSLANRMITLNLTGFYYDYKGYQVAKFVNQTVSNENIDATVKGLEFEGAFEPVRGLRFDTQIGYLNTRIKSGTSIDSMNRAQGDPTLAQVRSIDSGSFANSCILPVAVLASVQAGINAGAIPSEAMGSLCTGPFAVPGAMGGIPVQLNGKQLPNAPHWTMSLGAEYTADLGLDWRGTLRADFYRQTSSFARIYNTAYDQIGAYNNLNLSLRFASDSKGLEIMGYARNLLDNDAITNIRVGNEETGGERTVFGKDRATYGVIVTKRF